MDVTLTTEIFMILVYLNVSYNGLIHDDVACIFEETSFWLTCETTLDKDYRQGAGRDFTC